MLTMDTATETDAPGLAALYAAAAADLTGRFGPGNWSGSNDETSIRHLIRDDTVCVARDGTSLAGGLRLTRQTPPAIEISHFTPARQPIYLNDLAVAPGWQGKGIGRQLMAFSEAGARKAGHDAVRLDAYDHDVGAAGFYVHCGYVERGRVVFHGTPLIYFEKSLRLP
jgi:GNAT superfamily N-acetyltransferase